MICPNCRFQVSAGAVFCPNCGTKLPQQVVAEQRSFQSTLRPPSQQTFESPSQQTSRQTYQSPSQQAYQSPSQQTSQQTSRPTYQSPSQQAYQSPSQQTFESPSQQTSRQTYQSPSQQTYQTPSQPKKRNNMLLVGIVTGAAALIGVIVLIVVLLAVKKPAPQINAGTNDDTVTNNTQKDSEKDSGKNTKENVSKKPEERYAYAEQLLEDGDYAKAEEVLRELKDYQDAAKLAAYASACLKREEQNFEQAKKAFEALGSFKDAKEQAGKCQEQLTYLDAVEKMNAKDYSAAAKLFESIPGVNDADSLKAKCKAQITNEQIDHLLADGKWADALALLDSEDGKTYPNRDSVVKDCKNRTNYAAALNAMENKYYYTAYKLFSELGDYEKSKENARLCKRPLPETGELYRNQEYKRQAVQLNLDNANDGYFTYVRIYDAQGQNIVSTVFLHPGKTAVIYLPDKTYILKAAYSKTAEWFGELEMFGEDATYKNITSFSLSLIGWGYWYYTFDDRLKGTTESIADF